MTDKKSAVRPHILAEPPTTTDELNEMKLAVPGRKLLGGEASIYVDSDGIEDLAMPLSVTLRFDNSYSIQLRCAADGESLLLEHPRHEEEYSMGDWGSVKNSELVRLPVIGNLAGDVVSNCGGVCDEFGRLVGLALEAVTAGRVYLVVLGDELVPTRVLPNDMRVIET